MSVDELNPQSRRLVTRSMNVGRGAALAILVGSAMLSSCSADGSPPGSSGTGGSSNGNGGNNSTNSGGSGGSSSGNGGSSSGNGGSSAGNGGSAAGNGGSAAGNGGSAAGNGGSAAGNGGSAAGNGGSAAGNGGSGNGGSGNGGSAGIRDAGGDALRSDASACTNTDMTAVNIDSSGRICNNQWGIQGAWYCYTSPSGTSMTCPNATMTGTIPFDATANAICMRGTTGGSADPADYGAAIGMELNNLTPNPANKGPFNATTKNVIGFAITVTGNSGGSVLNINFPQIPFLFPTQKAAAVTVPGPTGTSVTYNIPLSQAMVGDNGMGTFPPPVFNPAALTDVQVAIPGGDGIAHAYNICVTKVVPLMAAPAAPATLGNFGAVVSEGKQIFLENMGPYAIQNDPFVVGNSRVVNLQAMYGGGQIGFSATPTFSSGGVGAYPSILLGWVQGGYFVGGGAPGAYLGGKTIGPGANTLTTATSSWAFTPGGGANYDAAYDIWFANGITNPLSAGFELMVWLNASGVGPIGGPGAAANVGGRAVHVATGTNPTGQPVISYVIDATTNSVTNLDLLPFFRDAVGRGIGLTAASYLLSVHAGFELYGGSTPWTTTSFSATIQ